MRTDVTAINAKSISVNGTPIAGSPAAFGQWTTFDQLDADVVLALNGVVIQGTIPPGGVVFTNYENVNVLSGAGLADSVIYGSPSSPASNASTGPLNPGSGTPTPTPTPYALAQYPRIAIVGPSTSQHNIYGFNSGSQLRAGALASGPTIWALAYDRRGKVYIEPANTSVNTSAYFVGDVVARESAEFVNYPAQISTANARLAAVPRLQKVIQYNVGRNPLPAGATFDDYKAAIDRDILAMRAGDYQYIYLAGLWNRPLASGTGWVSGGSYRVIVKAVNDYMKLLVAQDTTGDLKFIDYEAYICDNTADLEPFSYVYRTDLTHITAKGAQRMGRAEQVAYAATMEARAYPASPAENTIAAFDTVAGTGTLSGGATGQVVDGFTVIGNAALTVVCSVVDIGGFKHQRIAISGANAIAANGLDVIFRKLVSVPLAAGVKHGFRSHVRIQPSNVPFVYYPAWASSVTGGNPAVSHRTASMIALEDATLITLVAAAGATFAPAKAKYGATELLDLAHETPTFVQGAAGGSNLPCDFNIVVGPGSTDTLTFDIGMYQHFLWPI